MAAETAPPVDEFTSVNGRHFTRLDYILIPLLSVMTVFAILATAETGARLLWPEHEYGNCLANDPVVGPRAKPNCTDRLKNAEGPWVTYHYNECGYRTEARCGPKAPGTIRIALLGSSLSEGLYVPLAQTFAQRAARELSRATQHIVEVQNLGVPSALPLHCYRKLDSALALHPDLVVYAITPFDLERDTDVAPLKQGRTMPLNSPRPAVTPHLSLEQRLQSAAAGSRALLVARHFLFFDPKLTWAAIYNTATLPTTCVYR